MIRALAAGSLLAAMLVAAPTTAANASVGSVPMDGWEQRAKASQGFQCRDRLARMLHRVGFRGHSNRMAYAIVMRESKGQSLDESSRWFSGALGIWQIQTSAHRGKWWWSRSAMLDQERQSRIVYRYMSNRGTWWRAWGLTPDGRLDATHYRRWSAWQHENWIMRPFRKYYAAYPCR